MVGTTVPAEGRSVVMVPTWNGGPGTGSERRAPAVEGGVAAEPTVGTLDPWSPRPGRRADARPSPIAMKATMVCDASPAEKPDACPPH